MKKKILTQLFIVSFAFAGLFLVGNNLRSQPGNPGPGGTYYQSMSYCGGWGMKLCCTEEPRAYRCSRYQCWC